MDHGLLGIDLMNDGNHVPSDAHGISSSADQQACPQQRVLQKRHVDFIHNGAGKPVLPYITDDSDNCCPRFPVVEGDPPPPLDRVRPSSGAP